MNKSDLVKVINHLLDSNMVLRDTFGHTTTLGEMWITLVRQKLALTGEPVSVTRLALATGYAKSTVSAMVRRNPHLKMEPHPDDDRVKVITAVDPSQDVSYLMDIIVNARKLQYDQGFIETESLKGAIVKHLEREGADAAGTAVDLINARSRGEHQISREE